ncbi:MAG: Cys-Gln thioester bond-forming surface protein [Oscillospiraceae bacterium]|nr:Cys-Gln thioester bond-forming surface protein [Oscillospiraceae bacterium]
MKKRLATFLLAVITALSLIPTVAFAASSEQEALGEIDIYSGGDAYSYLSINGSVQTFLYTYYNYVSANGQVKEIPAYCVNPNLYGVPQTVEKGESIKYIANEKASDPKVMGIIANGYPCRSLAELKLDNKEQAYYATKAALWCYIIPNWNINSMKINPSLTGDEKVRGEKILAAAKDIYQRGTLWNDTYEPNLTVTPDRATAYPVTINGKAYKQQVFTVWSETWICNYKVDVAFADSGAVPAGTRIVNMNNQDITSITTTDVGDGYGGQFKVLYPADAVDGKSGTAQFTLRTEVYSYGIYYAICAEKDKYGNLQNYMCDTDPTVPMALSGLSSYSTSETVKMETGLTIIKKETGTDQPLSGALFEIIDPNGATVGIFSSNDDGEINVPLALAGNYTVIERQSAPNHKLGENTTQNVMVRYGEVATLTFYNDPYGTLRVQKLSDTGDYLTGVTIQVKNIQTGVTQTKRTVSAGVATFDVEPGSYEIRELAGIFGWQADTETVKTAQVLTGETTTVTFINKELPGLRITKYDRSTYELMSGVTFEIWRDGESLGKFQTDAMGEILLIDCEPGTYLVQEVDTGDDGHVLDTTPQTVELKAGDGIKELVFFNDRLPGLHLVKVDSSDLSKVIPNAKFRFEAVDGGYGPVELTTGEDGTIDLSKLPVGSYVVTELECPGYVADNSQRLIHLHGNETAQFIFTNSALPSLKLTKYSADGTPLAGVSYRLSKIEDGSRYLDRTTSTTGEIVWEGLEPGVYALKEISTVETHILDPKEYHVELFSGQDSFVALQNDKRPNLTIHKNDADTGAPVPDTVFIVKAADGSTVGEYKTRTDGTVTVKNLLPMVYEVVEKSVPSPYLLDAPSQLITLHSNRNTDLYFENHKIPSVEIIKINAKNRSERIPNVTFEIRKADDTLVTTVKTDKNGQVTVPLENGNYYAVEVDCPEDFKLDSTPHPFTIKDNKTTTLTITNQPLSGIVIYKTDSVTGKGIPGVSFLVYDRWMVPIRQVTTTQNGYAYVEGLNADGRYHLRELDNEGYIPDTEIKSVYVREGEVTRVNWKNTPITGQIQIVKTSADYNPTNGLPAGVFLEGAVFEIYNERTGNKVDTIVSGANGLAVSQQLPLGRYIIREVKAPAHYMVNDTPMTAVLEYSSQIIRFEVANKSVATGVAITKTGPKEAVSGQPVRYVFSGIANTGNVTLDSFYWRDNLPAVVTLDKVVTGTYNRPGTYKVIYKVNGAGEYHTLADNLSTAKSYTLDARPATLGLAANERITEVMFVFGQAPAAFAQVEAPMLYCTAVSGLGAGSSFTNTADVGGVYNGAWVQAVTRWTTVVYGKPTLLPRTGY